MNCPSCNGVIQHHKEEQHPNEEYQHKTCVCRFFNIHV
jgi:hypothetical protein